MPSQEEIFRMYKTKPITQKLLHKIKEVRIRTNLGPEEMPGVVMLRMLLREKEKEKEKGRGRKLLLSKGRSVVKNNTNLIKRQIKKQCKRRDADK